VSHLSEEQRDALLQLLDEFKECFSDAHGLCTVVQHEIYLTDDFKPRQTRAYRVPELLKAEIEKQIAKLLELDFIEETDSPMTSGVVCVTKPECVHHRTCDSNFRTGRNIPQKHTEAESMNKCRKVGRLKNEDQEQAFLKTCTYLEANDDEQITLSDLSSKMKDYLENEESTPFGTQYLKCKLKEHYKDSISFAEREGQTYIVTMKNCANS